ncbi:3-keto-5-aminohexanoate cleavage protein [Streptomyces caniscabiei]
MIEGLTRIVGSVRDVDPDGLIMLCAAGRASAHLATEAALMGLHIRVGMEDTYDTWSPSRGPDQAIDLHRRGPGRPSPPASSSREYSKPNSSRRALWPSGCGRGPRHRRLQHPGVRAHVHDGLGDVPFSTTWASLDQLALRCSSSASLPAQAEQKQTGVSAPPSRDLAGPGNKVCFNGRRQKLTLEGEEPGRAGSYWWRGRADGLSRRPTALVRGRFGGPC